jgi:hypothetical protein
LASSALERFKARLALTAYFRDAFGVGDIHDPRSVRDFYGALEGQREGYDAEGRSYVYRVLQGRVRCIDAPTLLAYDVNVGHHTEALNRGRSEPIVLKYFQVLAALMTEHYLDRATREPDAFLADLNAFVLEQNKAQRGPVDFPSFSSDDLSKLAYWMATGSGKTLLMHLNYYQYLHYQPGVAENILLVTPNEGLSQQHITEMRKSGIPCRRFDATTSDLFAAGPNAVKVIEITKVVEEKSGGGKSVDVSHLEGRNLVFVDEGHKGAGSEAQAWRSRRAALAESGFTFEYSATFGQGVSGAGTEIEEEYGKAILLDYSYPRFYHDGYGKDYRILNLEQELTRGIADRYLLANLLSFYEQLRCYATNYAAFYHHYNVQPPLLVFIGHTVTAEKTWSTLGAADHQSLSDVQEQVLFLHRVLRNEGDWVPAAIEDILGGQAGLEDADGKPLFRDAFPTLRSIRLDGEAFYTDMLQRLFHVAASSSLHLVDLHSAEGEIGLRASAADRFFGLINIGDAPNFLKLVKDRMPEIVIDEEQFTDSLFRAINRQDSAINVLIGAKRFIEGWDSWRVSTMGLMNIGRGEGPQIIQLFGRGVRLLGKDRSLKRSTRLEGPHPGNLPLLETLNIFGVRAKYMAQFRDYLTKEGIDVEERETVAIPTRISKDLQGRDLLVVRPQAGRLFEEQVRLALDIDEGCVPTINLMPRAEKLVSEGLVAENPEAWAVDNRQWLPTGVLALFDRNRVYREIWQFRTTRGYRNLLVSPKVLGRILETRQYELRCPPSMLQIASFADVRRLEDIALMILRKYVDRYYAAAHRKWEQDQMAYHLLDQGDDNLITAYEARVKSSAVHFLQTLREMLSDAALYDNDKGLPNRVHFDRHLYLPLLLEDQGTDPVVRYVPPGLNPGEGAFVKHLRRYVSSPEAQALLVDGDLELFLLRNQSRGRGVGFLVDAERYFPDFIMWVKHNAAQDIVFVDPHGLITAGDLDANPKVRFGQTIKEYQEKLNKRAGRDDVGLHSYIISQTSFEKLAKQTGLTSRDEFHARHVYFTDDDQYPRLLLADVLNASDG